MATSVGTPPRPETVPPAVKVPGEKRPGSRVNGTTALLKMLLAAGTASRVMIGIRREDRERFELEVEHAAPGRDLELFVIDPDGGEESQGALTVGLDGDAEWELRGDGLPFGVSSVADLEGYEVVVAGPEARLYHTVMHEVPPSSDVSVPPEPMPMMYLRSEYWPSRKKLSLRTPV